MPNENIGFIGLGLMGSAMVSRLQDLDYQVSVCANKSRPNIEAAIARGAHEVETACALAQTSDIILLCMDTSASVEARMRGHRWALMHWPSTTCCRRFSALGSTTK